MSIGELRIKVKRVILTGATYDAANRLTGVDGQAYTWDDNGNLLDTGVQTNSFDATNRLIQTQRGATTLQPIYNGLNDRVGQTTGANTTTFALDVAAGLPEVIATSDGSRFLHLPGLIVAQNAAGDLRYLLPDGLGSVRQAVDSTGAVAVYREFDPYGNPVENGGDPYGYTGEWWEDEVGLLHLRARWIAPEVGIFLSRDSVESEPPYLYVRGNPINLTDPTGLYAWVDNSEHSKQKQHWAIETWFEDEYGFWNTHIEFNKVRSEKGYLRQDIIYFPELARGTSSPIDFFGFRNEQMPKTEIYEIEPMTLKGVRDGLKQLRQYEAAIKKASNRRDLKEKLRREDNFGKSTSPYAGQQWDFNDVN